MLRCRGNFTYRYLSLYCVKRPSCYTTRKLVDIVENSLHANCITFCPFPSHWKETERQIITHLSYSVIHPWILYELIHIPKVRSLSSLFVAVLFKKKSYSAKRRLGKCTPMEYKCFPQASFITINTPLALVILYPTYESDPAKLITQEIWCKHRLSHCSFSCISLMLVTRKITAYTYKIHTITHISEECRLLGCGAV
jgi:hypothetical protein